MSYEITWAEDYGARFKQLSGRDVEVWEEILRNEIRNLAAGEIAKAVRRLGEEKQQGKHKYAPSVEDLKAAIIKNRWLSSPRRNEPGRAACALCGGNGWIPFGVCVQNHEQYVGEWVTSVGVSRHKTDGWPYYIFAAPCRCTLGERQLNAYRVEDRGNITELSKDVLEFKKTINSDSPMEDQLMAIDEG
jgi:hypothetical protein